MTLVHRKTIERVLACATFVLVVVCSAGCAQMKAMLGRGGSASSPDRAAEPPVSRQDAGGYGADASAAPARPPDDADIFDSAPVARQATPPIVNVFGEFDGIERSAPQASASASAGLQQHTFVDEGYDSDVAVDPNGQWIAFASTRHAENTDIYLQKVDGLSVTQLTSDPADDVFPVFSPDGKQIAFCSTRAGNWDLYVMDADGRNVVQVTSGPMQDLHPSFSPDGTRLAYCSLGYRSDQWELWIVNLATHERQMIGTGLFPVWSPDKSKDQIAFQRARQRGGRWFSLWTLDLVNGEAMRMTEVAVSSNAAIVSPAWSPDGKHLTFATIVEPARTAGGKPQGQQDIWIIDPDGANRRRLTDGSGTNLEPYWASDNRVYFISDRGGREAVWSVSAGTPAKVSTAGADSDGAVEP